MNIKEIDKKMDEFDKRLVVCSECLESHSYKKVTKTKDGCVCGKCIVTYRIKELDDMAVASGIITNEERIIK
jgi:hypothetical protein